MKHAFTFFATIALALAAVSCNKDYITPEELLNDDLKAVRTKVHTKGDNPVDAVTKIDRAVFWRTTFSLNCGVCSGEKSMLWAVSEGKMVYDFFTMNIYFDRVIDNMKVGDVVRPAKSMFTFPYSSDSNNSTESYEGRITIAAKGDDYVIIHFNKVRFSVAFGDYEMNGYLYCNIYDELSEDNIGPWDVMTQ